MRWLYQWEPSSMKKWCPDMIQPRYMIWARLQTPLVFISIFFGYFFYGQWDWRFLGLLAITTVLDYTAGRLLDRSEHMAPPDAPRRRSDKLIVAVSVFVNLSLLGFFKYFNFFAESAAAMLHRMGFAVHPTTLQVILPVGISFYTFQSIAYVIDVYRRQVRAEKNFITYATYVAFFPQLVAGPIERARHMMPQLKNPPPFALENFYRGSYLIGWGLFKKVVLADNMANFVDLVFRQGHPTNVREKFDAAENRLRGFSFDPLRRPGNRR